MALSEAEELEMLELENEEAQGGVRDAVAQPRTAADAGEALITNLPTKDWKQDVVRGLPATGGGIVGALGGASAGATIGGGLGGALGFALGGPPGAIVGLGLGAKAGGVIGGIGGAGVGAMAGEANRQAVSQMTAGAFPEQNYPMATGREVLRDVGIQGATNAAGQGIAGGVGIAAKYAAGKLAKPAVKVGAQVIRATTGTPEKSAAAVLRDPSILSRALPIDEAGAQYAASTGGLKSGAEGAREVLGKSHWSGAGIADKFDELLPAIQDGSMDAQTALVLRQRTMKALNDLPYNERELGRILSQNIEQLDSFLEPKLPSWGAGKTGYRESMVAEDFNSWLPLNKNLSPNVLRTGAAIAAAANSASQGKLLGMAALPLVSPKVWGLGIRGVAGAANVAGAGGGVIYKVASRSAAGGAGSSLSDEYNRMRPALP